MLTGNKGEWSELYVFFKLLADGKLNAADAELNKIEAIYYPVIEIIRHQAAEKWRYKKNGDIKIIDAESGKNFLTVPTKKFIENTDILLDKIKIGTGAFAIPELKDFMEEINCKKLKAPSADKTDITLVVHDLNTGFKPTLGFSIKSQLGSPSTLLNPSQATNFIYKVNHLDAKLLHEINSINSNAKIRDRIREIEVNGGNLQYYDVENEIFKLNLQVIDSNLPLILSDLILNYYRGNARDITDLLYFLEKENPCHYIMTYEHNFYPYKIKTFLTDIALGMKPTEVWNGRYDATGGYIIVKEDGDLLCYHIYNRNEFQNYLIRTTRLETPSSSRYEFGKLYIDGETIFIKLNLQIRFKA